MQFELTQIAFALAAYRADHGSYPESLAALSPQYMTEVPQDIFSEADLHYALDENGYTLYSVGENEVDDGARRFEDRQEADEFDDLVVRIKHAVK